MTGVQTCALPISLIGVSTYIKIKRKQLKLTQKDLAIKAGVGLRFIRELEQGNKTNFNTDGVLKILRLFGGKLTVSVGIKIKFRSGLAVISCNTSGVACNASIRIGSVFILVVWFSFQALLL